MKILVVPDSGDKKNKDDSQNKSSIRPVGTYTKNIVYREILTG